MYSYLPKIVYFYLLIVKKFFNGSVSNFASFFTEDEDLSISELEQIKKMVEQKITDKKNYE